MSMAQAEKPESSTGKAKSKKSFLDEDISKDFLSSWKSMSVTSGNDMDFNFEPVAKGKNKAFNFGVDMDFSLDDAFGKMPSFKLDVQEIECSSSPKKALKITEKNLDKESAEGSYREKNDKPTVSFDFNEDRNENGENKSTMVADTVPQGGQGKNGSLHLPNNEKTSSAIKSSGDDPCSEGIGQRLDDCPSACNKELMKSGSAVEKREKNADVSSAGDNIENREMKTKIVVGAEPCDGRAEKADNKKMSNGIKSSRNKAISFVEAFGSLPSLKLDMPVTHCYASPRKSSKFKVKLSKGESSKGVLQKKSDELSSALPLTEKVNAPPVSKENEVPGVVETPGSDNFTLDTVACSASNISKSMNSKLASNAGMEISGLKDSPAPSDSNRLASLVARKEVPKFSNKGHEKLKGKISSKLTFPPARTDKTVPSLPSSKISKNIFSNKQLSSYTVNDPNPMENHEKSSRLQMKTKITPVSSLKRKPPEAADLHPSKRLSPCENRKLKVSAIEVENHAVCYTCPVAQTEGAEIEKSKKNVTADNPSPELDCRQEANMENLSFTLMVEGHVNVEKTEACAKELDDICSMLKKKHDEAKELLIRALINNNYLLMLNSPSYEEKIRDVQRFASRLMSNSRAQEAGV